MITTIDTQRGFPRLGRAARLRPQSAMADIGRRAPSAALEVNARRRRRAPRSNAFVRCLLTRTFSACGQVTTDVLPGGALFRRGPPAWADGAGGWAANTSSRRPKTATGGAALRDRPWSAAAERTSAPRPGGAGGASGAGGAGGASGAKQRGALLAASTKRSLLLRGRGGGLTQRQREAERAARRSVQIEEGQLGIMGAPVGEVQQRPTDPPLADPRPAPEPSRTF